VSRNPGEKARNYQLKSLHHVGERGGMGIGVATKGKMGFHSNQEKKRIRSIRAFLQQGEKKRK